MSGYIKLTISNIEEIAPDFKVFSFVDDHSIKYAPGQFLTLIDRPGAHEIRRSYSIISIPFLKEQLAIGVKRIENGHFSRKLIDKARIGDTLLCSGAKGFFKLPDPINHVSHIVLFAAGSGITPVYSLLRSALYQHTAVNVILFYSSRTPATTALYDQLKSLEQLFGKRLTIHFLFSAVKDLGHARLTRDILIDFIGQHQPNLHSSYFYTCGPETYMMKVMFVLQEFGIDKERIRKEEFVMRKTVAHPVPPDIATHTVTIRANEKDFAITVNYPDTILQAARKINAPVDYSCESGKCGSCVATCIKGHIWMSANEVLTDDDLAKGLVLTCTGHPIGGDVVLRV